MMKMIVGNTDRTGVTVIQLTIKINVKCGVRNNIKEKLSFSSMDVVKDD
jgi:hypothetical protein